MKNQARWRHICQMCADVVMRKHTMKMIAATLEGTKR